MWSRGRPWSPPRTRKVEWLLALLALQRGQPLDRDWLAGLLWPESAGPKSLYNLRRALSDLRHALGCEATRLSAPGPRALRLELTGATVDVIAFDAAVARGDEASLEAAVALYRGPFLPGCTAAWAVPERLSREQDCMAALETLSTRALSRGNAGAAVRHLQRAVGIDPLRESAQRALMRALATRGDLAAVILAYREFRLLLHRELHAEPAPETKALYQQLRAEARERESPVRERGGERRRERGSEGGRERKQRASGPSLPQCLNRSIAPSLPRPLTELIGRRRSVEEVQQHLARRRLVTLTGPGGVGKTRLAIQVAVELQETSAVGICFVDLSSIQDGARAPRAIAAARGLPSLKEAAAGDEARALVEALADAQLLLVLDTCEHLVAACAPLVERLLHACPGVRVLATSRRALGLLGETVYEVPPLSLPAPPPLTFDTLPSALLQSAAVRLFVDRAAAAHPGFTLTPGNAAAVARICRRLDGIPFAIELAAARVQSLPIAELARRLDRRFELLTQDSRTAPPRHQTLRATMDWSYDLLSPPGQALLRQLSVFSGVWTLEAAEAVCACGASVECEV